MNEAKLQEIFAQLDTEALIEQLQEYKDNTEVKVLIKNQIGQEFIKLLAIAESLDIDFEDAINAAVSELELEHDDCDDEECDSDECKNC